MIWLEVLFGSKFKGHSPSVQSITTRVKSLHSKLKKHSKNKIHKAICELKALPFSLPNSASCKRDACSEASLNIVSASRPQSATPMLYKATVSACHSMAQELVELKHALSVEKQKNEKNVLRFDRVRKNQLRI